MVDGFTPALFALKSILPNFLSKNSLHHVVHTGFISDVNVHRHRLERGLTRQMSCLYIREPAY